MLAQGKVRMYWERNKRNVIFMLIYAVINIILYLYFFLGKYIHYRQSLTCYQHISDKGQYSCHWRKVAAWC